MLINDGGSTATITGLKINDETITAVSLAQGDTFVSIASLASMSQIANTDTAFLNAMIDAINDATDTTNVAARAGSGNSLILIADEGKNIEIGYISGVMTTVASFYNATGLASGYYALSTDTTTYNGESSAIAKVAAIDSIKSSTAVDALVVATTKTGSGAVTAATVAAGDIYINGIDIGAVTVLAGDASGALLAAINSKSSTTGVSASLDSQNKLVLSAADGRNISLVAKSAASTSIGITSDVYRGGVKLNSSENFTIAGSTVDLGGIDTKTYTTSLDYAVSLIDLSTQVGADDALATLDAAVYQINTTRSQLGAIQSRISLTIMSLTTTAENLSASESRIRDVDFAEETSVLTKNSILTQAATAILAQANQLPQLALQLLGG
jgi:flagellin